MSVASAVEERALAALLEHERIAEDDRPSSFSECVKDDYSIDMDLHAQHRQKEDDLERAEKNSFQTFMDLMQEGEVQNNRERRRSTKKRNPRSSKTLRPHYFDSDGHIQHLKPRETLWYVVCCTDQNDHVEVRNKLFSKFRRRFRMLFAEFRQLLRRVMEHDLFQRWMRPDATGSPPSPIGLLVLGSLRHLGRGLTFDDLEECTAIAEETHRQFFHKFIECGQTVLFPEFVCCPVNAQQHATHTSEFTTGGLCGCGHSTNGTHVIMWRCEHNLKQANSGFKDDHPCRAYNVSVNHRRRTLWSTSGHPARWNDKTLIWNDEFVRATHDGRILQDVEFTLHSWSGIHGNSQLKETRCAGAWGLVDNGHHKWTCTQAPAKVNLLLTQQRLSDWIESYRKDVECTFGMLKGRWRVLQTGIRLEGAVAANRIWMTCCALHNWLLEVDGLDKQWEEGVPSDWQGSLGNNDADECRRHAPFAIHRLNNPQLERFGSTNHQREAQNRRAGELDLEQVGNDDDEVTDERRNANGAICVNSLAYADFRERLVVHFDMLHRQHKVRWPTRNPPNEVQQMLNLKHNCKKLFSI